MKPMRKLVLQVLGLVALGTLASASVAVGAEQRSGEQILDQITKRARAFESAYLGSFSRRDATTRILDGDDGELQLTREVVVEVWEYHGEAPINEVLECKIDNKPVEFAKCIEERRIKPAYRLFGADAEKHYRLEYVEVSSWKGQASHQIRVIPLEDTTRHLKGHVYFLVGSLRLAGMDLTLADYPFGLKNLSIELNFKEKDGLPVIASGLSEVHIYVPFLINTRKITQFKASEQRLLKERHVSQLPHLVQNSQRRTLNGRD